MIEYNKPVKPLNDVTNGYQYFKDPEHPLCQRNGKAYYHRHVASVKIGRWVRDDEHVHHKDHNRCNNDPSNLEVLSSEEHKRRHKPRYLKDRKCERCNEVFTPDKNVRKYCSHKCAYQSRRKSERPTKEQLTLEVYEFGYSATGKKYGVSDNAIRKWMKI